MKDTRYKKSEVAQGGNSYSDPVLHKRIGDIIKSHSENPVEVREVIKEALDWKGIRSILDLGCGYGWFEEALGGRFALVAGIDTLEENRASFLKVARRISDEALFYRMHLPCPIPLDSSSFDLIVSCYSLYFFPESLPEIFRLLQPDGTAVIVTHSEAMLGEGEEFFRFRELRRLIERFSAENGEGLLRNYFALVTSIDYSNYLIFDADDGEDLAAYIRFKGDFISRDADPEEVRERLLQELRSRGSLRFNKNDRIFLVRK